MQSIARKKEIDKHLEILGFRWLSGDVTDNFNSAFKFSTPTEELSRWILRLIRLMLNAQSNCFHKKKSSTFKRSLTPSCYLRRQESFSICGNERFFTTGKNSALNSAKCW